MKQACFYIMFLLAALVTSAQKSHFELDGNDMLLRVEISWSKRQLDSVCALYDIPYFSKDSLFNYSYLGTLANDGWKIKKKRSTQIVLKRSMKDDWGTWNDMEIMVSRIFDMQIDDGSDNRWTTRVFGFNAFSTPSIRSVTDSTSEFRLIGFEQANSVLLSGTFNEWSTSGPFLTKVEGGWSVIVPVKPGRHEYKFIVDGSWIKDPNNELKISDNFGSFNSIYFKENYSFELQDMGFQKVIVAGSFNDWNESKAQMKKVGSVWQLKCFIPDGDYQYKFIADDRWMIDSKNTCKQPNEYNDFNSCFSIGEKTSVLFELEGALNAKQVILAGAFNGWDEMSLSMKKTTKGWESTVPIRKGFHAYRYIIDGSWFTDPSKPQCNSSEPGQKDNFVIVEANHHFVLNGFENANKVSVSGSFNDWDQIGYAMKKEGNTWVLPYYFEPGKVSYKFIVDGQWILDPANPIKEENEFGTGNSVFWKE